MLNKLKVFTSEGTAFLFSMLAVASMPLLPEFCAPVLAVAALFFAHRDARKHHTGLRIGTLGKLLLIYIAYSAFGILYSAHRGNSAATVLMWGVMFLLYLTLTTVITTNRRLRIALFFIAAATGCVGAVACAQYILRDLMNFSSLPNQFWYRIDTFFYNHFPMSIDLTMGIERSAGTFNNPNMLAEYLVMTIPLVGYFGFHGKRTGVRMVGRCFTVLAVFGVAVSFSRGAYLALLSMLLLLVFTHLRQITPFMLCLVAAISLIPEAVIGRFLSIGEGGNAIFERLDAWEVAVHAIVQSPLVGLGPGVSNLWELLNRMGVNAPHAHNLILQILVEGGFVAMFIMCLVAAKLLQDSLGLLNRSAYTAPTGLTFLIFAVAFVVHGMVDYPFLSPKLVGTFCLVLGFFEAMSAQFSAEHLIPLSKLPAPLLSRLSRAKKEHTKHP